MGLYTVQCTVYIILYMSKQDLVFSLPSITNFSVSTMLYAGMFCDLFGKRMALWWLLDLKTDNYDKSKKKVPENSVVYHIVRAKLSDKLRKNVQLLKHWGGGEEGVTACVSGPIGRGKTAVSWLETDCVLRAGQIPEIPNTLQTFTRTNPGRTFLKIFREVLSNCRRRGHYTAQYSQFRKIAKIQSVHFYASKNVSTR